MLPVKAFLRPILPALWLALIASPVFAQDQSGISLEEALRLAGVESPIVAISQAEVDVAKGNERQAGIGPNPEVSLEVENVAGSGAFSGLRSNETTLMLTQPIELGGKKGARLRAAQAQSGLAELDAQIMQADLALMVRQRFTDAVAARERLLLAQDVLERNAELARIANELVDAGREPPLRAIRAKAGLGEAQANLREAEANDLKARLALAELWGAATPPDAVEITWLELENIDNLGNVADTLALQRAGAELQAAEAVIERERANAVPDLNIGAGLRRFEDTNDTAFTIGASMEIPLRNRNQGSIEAANAAARATEGRMLLIRLQLQREQNSLVASINAAQTRVDTLTNSTLPNAEEALELARKGYRFGKFNLIDVLDAAAARDDARSNLIKAKEELAQATASLVRLTQKQGGIAS
ncbi:hypothetical protein LPB140_10360 [Sphingorhabdus lutea]|uniref:TolC family protein n=1 Tax=Sphingorhabdus lutea TaxID=1913578 RepID=A0A1L3JDC0_9SPHN|nr:TolC family protein [Sphingorhabdus lutea]APG63120.1 hypothetical protein LPB140_10360 [Sphingorhabdus lutea]